jgi:microcystin degradation protein MlrC
MRVAVAALSQETGTFLPFSSDLDRLRCGVMLFGDELFSKPVR